METEEEETLDLPMMSNREISSVDHYIIDLSCDLKSKCFIGSITLFMQPTLKSKTLHPENNKLHVRKSSSHQCGTTPKNVYSSQTKELSTGEQPPSLPHPKTDDTPASDPKVGILSHQIHNLERTKQSAFSTQCIKTSEGVYASQTRELSTSLTNSKISNKATSDSKVGVLNQHVYNSKTDMSQVSTYRLEEDKESITADDANEDILHVSVPATNTNIPLLPTTSQKTEQLFNRRDNFKVNLHCPLSHDDNVDRSKVAQCDYSVAVSSLPLSYPQTGDPGLNDHTKTFESTSTLTLEGNMQEKTSDKVSEGKRKSSDGGECSVNSKPSKLIKNLSLLNETSGIKELTIPLEDQTFEAANVSVAESGIPVSSSSAPSDISDNDQPFVLILDACDIRVSRVELLDVPKCEICHGPCLKCGTESEREKSLRFCSKQAGRKLMFATTKWSLRIWDEHLHVGGFDATSPFVVRIEYSILPEGKSLKWVMDQDHNMTTFTRGDFINNRSLFPSQDHPETLSTWQAYITVSEPNIVLMTGDKEAVVTQQDNGFVQFYYQSTMLMPSSTVAIAIGQWQSLTIINSESLDKNESEKWIPEFCSQLHNSCSVNFSEQPTFPCRVFAPKCLMPRAKVEFQHYLPRCLAEMHDVLGPHPFCRLDILIVPSCFESLGMANPCLIFLSESVLVGNLSFCSRLSHEVSHSWFGLVLGPKDWTEEWMTEGFASFLEDVVHPKVIGMNEKEAEDWFELRALIKHRVLTAELSHTEEELQIMRINESDSVANKSDKTSSVKNGLNPDKKCLQVHYLKGYFLLRFFSQKVGLPPFKVFLRKYVQHFHGQLVTSQDFLQMFFKEFPELLEEGDGFNDKQICDEWLDKPGLPKVLENLCPNKQVELINDVYQQVEAIRWGIPSFAGLKFKPVCEDQVTLLLELLLDVPCPKLVLEKIYQQYHISKSNPDVRHRWCELVIKYKFAKFYKDVKHFLLHDQAMGIYLFGELMLSNSTKQKRLAKDCFLLLKDNMDDRLRKSVEELIYG